MAAAAVAALAVIVVVFLPLTPAYDVQVFLRAGRAILHGWPVYPPLGSPAVYSGSSFVYPYLAAWPFVPLAALPTGLAVALFFVANVCAVAAAALLGGGEMAKVGLVLATAYTITGLQLGSLSPLLFAGAVFMWRLREHPRAFGPLAAAVVASKLFLAPLLLWPLIARRHRAFAWAAGCTAAVLAAGFVVGPLGPAGYLGLLSRLGAHEATQGFSLTGAFMTAGLTSAEAEAAAVAVAISVLGVAVARFRHLRAPGRLGSRREEHVIFAGAVVASLIASPVVWSHYLVLLAAALLAAGARHRWFLALAVASWVMSPPHGLTIHVQASQGVESHGAWLALAIMLTVFAYALWRRDRRRGARASAAGRGDGVSLSSG